MAEYFIIAVAYSEDEQHIDWLLIGREVDSMLSLLSVAHRQFVVDLIDSGSASFRTVTLDKSKNAFRPGSYVQTYDKIYLTTVRDALEENNLENLPVFVMPNNGISDALAEMLERDLPGSFV